MSRERNEKQRKNRLKKEMAFENSKASFVAGIVVIITVLNDTIGLIMPIPRLVELIEVIVCFLLAYFALGTKKMNRILNKTGVEKFGGFLTVYSVIIFLVEKMFIKDLVCGRIFTFVMFLIFSLMGIIGAISLLLYKDYPTDK